MRQPTLLTRSQRRRRNQTEAQVWPEAVARIGSPPAGACWIHVGDRAADMWPLFTACLTPGTDFVIRVQHTHRKVWLTTKEVLEVGDLVAHLPVLAHRTVEVRQQGGVPPVPRR